MKLTLRDYQEDALARVEAAHERGVKRPMIVAATGLGKTVMFCALAERRKARTLIVAHRDELIEQAAAKVREVWPEASVGVVKGERDEHHAQVVVASIQTLARAKRLARIVEQPPWGEPFGLVVVDEAHHSAADSYRRVIETLRCGEDDGPMLLGVTATPDRGDGKGLDDLFDEIVASYDILWGIGAGYLADVRGVAVSLDMDMSTVQVRRGDYDQGQAGAAISQAHGPAVIVRSWQEHAAGRRTLVFTPTVAVAEEVRDAFLHVGVRAGYVHGGTPLDERRAMLAAFSRGELDVVANCAVLTEGYDEPRVDCIVVARPTRSRALYTQMIGRGTRRHPDKDDLLVLDVVGATAEHSLVTVPSLFGVEGKHADMLRSGIAKASDMVQEFQAEQVRLGKLRAEDVDLFRRVRAEGIAWVATKPAQRLEGLRRYVRPLGTGKDATTYVLQQIVGGEDRWVAGVIEREGRKRTLMFDVNLETAQAVAEDAIRAHGFGHAALVRTDAPWRKRKPSAKMLAAAAKWRIAVDPGWNAGELSDALTARIAARNSR